MEHHVASVTVLFQATAIHYALVPLPVAERRPELG